MQPIKSCRCLFFFYSAENAIFSTFELFAQSAFL